MMTVSTLVMMAMMTMLVMMPIALVLQSFLDEGFLGKSVEWRP